MNRIIWGERVALLGPTLVARATRSGRTAKMLTEERRCKRCPGAASMQLCGCATPLQGALPLAQPGASQLSNLASILRVELTTALASAISEFASSSSCSWSLNYALLETSADKVVHHQGARARRALGTRATVPAHVVNMLTDEQQYSRHADAAAVLLCGRATPHCDL